jgi:hypothetical protein
VTELLSPFSKCNLISVSESQRGGFSKEGRERFPSKGSTLALKGFLTQSSSSENGKKMMLKQAGAAGATKQSKKVKRNEICQVLLPDAKDMK